MISNISWLREAAPYINQHRDNTFVIMIGGDVCQSKDFDGIVHDIALLQSLGIRIILVHGARAQITQALDNQSLDYDFIKNYRVTSEAALDVIKPIVGTIRFDIEAAFSVDMTYSPLNGANIKVCSGNLVVAKPLGILDGVNYLHTGKVRKVHASAINQLLDAKNIVLLSPIGVSPTGEMFNLNAEEVAVHVAKSINADKLIYLDQIQGLLDSNGNLVSEIDQDGLDELLRQIDITKQAHVQSACLACQEGVPRVHLIDSRVDGGLLREFFSRDGCGTLLTADPFEKVKPATIDDVGGILDLIKPLEESDVLVKRSREKLEAEISNFFILLRDNTIIGCAALYPFTSNSTQAELACVAVHDDYRNANRGEKLLERLGKHAKQQGIKELFVLTTQTSHWFQEQGFVPVELAQLPDEKQSLYNYQRNSQALKKML